MESQQKVRIKRYSVYKQKVHTSTTYNYVEDIRYVSILLTDPVATILPITKYKTNNYLITDCIEAVIVAITRSVVNTTITRSVKFVMSK